MVATIALHFDPDFPCAKLAGRSIELVAGEALNDGVALGKPGRYPAWVFGRDPRYADICVQNVNNEISGIHATILYDRSTDSFELLEGGSYPKPVVRYGQVVKPAGYAPSAMGVWLNCHRLEPRDKATIKPGDRILFNRHYKVIIGKSRFDTTGSFDWSENWKEVKPERPSVSASVLKELQQQNEEKTRPETIPQMIYAIANRVLNGPENTANWLWWCFLSLVALTGAYVYGKYFR